MAHDPYKYFRIESRELLEKIGKGVLDLEKGTPTSDQLGSVLRFAHTLKGAARVVKQREIAEDAHSIEDTLAPLRGGGRTPSREQVDAVLGLVDAISGRLEVLAPPAEAKADAPVEILRTVRADVAEMDELVEGVAESRAQLSSIRRAAGTLTHARELALRLGEQLDARRQQNGAGGDSASSKHLARPALEALQDALATLDRSLTQSVEQMERELKQVRERAERLRLVPAGVVFLSLERVVRDVAQEQRKQVVFEARNGEVRLDAHVLEEVQAALVQMVRNAVAHGIEPEDERKAAGKPPEGRVVVEVERRGRRVALVCRDDGRGFDLEAVRRALQKKGALPEGAMRLGPEELVKLLLAGGISTASKVTELSGRGIGLDVVRAAAQRLGGEVVARTEHGKGAVLELVVPVSLASLEGLLVESAGVAATIPLDSVRRTMRIAPSAIARSGERETVVCDGAVVPFMPLARSLLGAKWTPERVTRAWSAVVVKGEGGTAAFGVDRLLGAANVVLRPLPELAPAAAVVAGASLDAQGNPQLVLDPDGLVSEAQRASTAGSLAYAPTLAPILVIDDSLTTRMLEQSILESSGYEVDVATSGEEALEKARRGQYALFLVDIEMPGMDGFAFIEHTAADPILRSIPSILVSSRSSAEDRRRGEEVGARAYIAKSEFDQTELLERIRALVGHPAAARGDRW